MSESLLESYYKQHLQLKYSPSKTIFFQSTPPLHRYKLSNTDHEVQFVDIGAGGLALVSKSGPEFILEDWQYRHLVTALSGVHDLVLSYPDDANTSALDMWFNTAHDAGVRRYIIENPL